MNSRIGDYPAGDYDLTGGIMGPTEYTIDYAGDAYSNTPQLTVGSYTGLQDMNAADPYTVDFNAMVVSPNATPGANAIYFSILNSSDMTVFTRRAANDRDECDDTRRNFASGTDLYL